MRPETNLTALRKESADNTSKSGERQAKAAKSRPRMLDDTHCSLETEAMEAALIYKKSSPLARKQ